MRPFLFGVSGVPGRCADMPRIALGVSYRGSAYHGWQRQAGVPSVQQCVEEAIARFAVQPLATVCAGRTDAGVHALRQVLHLDAPIEREQFSWVRGVNNFLPLDVRITWAQPVPAHFHARNSAQRRRYRYLLHEGPVAPALAHGLMGWVFTPRDAPLQIAPMQAAAAHWLGEHDFSAFRAAECQALSPVKRLHHIGIERRGSAWRFSFEADAFLQHMVRNMMGTLLAVGSGKRPPAWAAELLGLRDRRRGDPTFMPDGLVLDGVAYPEAFGLAALSWQEDAGDFTSLAWPQP